MSIKVIIPPALKKLTNGKTEIETAGNTVIDLIENLERDYPGIKERICDETGKIRRFVNIYVNEKDIRFLKNEKTELRDGSEVSIVPAIAGGKKSKKKMVI